MTEMSIIISNIVTFLLRKIICRYSTRWIHAFVGYLPEVGRRGWMVVVEIVSVILITIVYTKYALSFKYINGILIKYTCEQILISKGFQ